MAPFQRPTAIRRKTLRMIIGASKDSYPNEFGAILRAEEGVITELLLIPGTIGGKRDAIFQLYHMPPAFTVGGRGRRAHRPGPGPPPPRSRTSRYPHWIRSTTRAIE